MTFVARTVLSPLLLEVEEELGVSHAVGGSFFLVISIGLIATMLLSSLVVGRMTHHTAVTLSGVISAAGLLLLATAQSVPLFVVGLFVVGAGAGLYLPSGVATLTDVVPAGQWGRAIALHELGPILALAGAPLFVEIALRTVGWRSLMVFLALISLGAATAFRKFGAGGRFAGATPEFRQLRELLRRRDFWIIGLLFVMALALEMGVYAMLPAYLVTGHGMDASLVNGVVSSSRLTSLIMVFLSGWMTDRFGYRRVIGGIALTAGGATAALGFTGGGVLITMVYLQPMLVSGFFPAGLTALAGVGRPEQRNLTVSLIIPGAYLLGAGGFPTILGRLAEVGQFDLGYLGLGSIMVLTTLLLPFMERQGAISHG